eukprot:TRINITY_DN37832_c0_g1_i2.p1 TRINITY_DN37832_c0_g1~~TRINITY_DN37832_c0_g1_i2.p1  ORF type:complete len:512 (-),score=98.27 TRINITY_DN37832_c0_g1_i2:390-1925(-)
MSLALGFYVLDLALRLISDGQGSFWKPTTLLDIFIIAISIFEQALQVWEASTQGASLLVLRMVRWCRLVRLVRVMRFFAGMKELKKLTLMIATCARTMFWSFVMSFLVMTVWSVMAVELVYPVSKKLAEEGMWGDCERCGRAFESVMAANLTFVQTILAGDSWGYLAVPILEEAPSTAFVFCGALMTLTYGIMQLITAVVVDSFADLRKLDVYSLAAEMNTQEQEEKALLTKVFAQIDIEGDGHLTFKELCRGAHKVKDFRDWLRVMDVDEHDLSKLFKLLDVDNSGTICLARFIDVLYRLRNAGSNTTVKMVKHVVDNLERTFEELAQRVEYMRDRLEEVHDVQLQMKGANNAVDSASMKTSNLGLSGTLGNGVEEALQRALAAVSLGASLQKSAEQIQVVMPEHEYLPDPCTSLGTAYKCSPSEESLYIRLPGPHLEPKSFDPYSSPSAALPGSGAGIATEDLSDTTPAAPSVGGDLPRSLCTTSQRERPSQQDASLSQTTRWSWTNLA